MAKGLEIGGNANQRQAGGQKEGTVLNLECQRAVSQGEYHAWNV